VGAGVARGDTQTTAPVRRNDRWPASIAIGRDV
jgi:hypothetical protein